MPKPNSPLDRYLERAVGSTDEEVRVLLRLLLWMMLGIYVWALLLSMEVFDIVDIDIKPGDQAPELSWQHVMAHGQNLLASLVLLTGIVGAILHLKRTVLGRTGNAST